MKHYPIVILGAGIVGRFAKVLMPEAAVFEKKEADSIFTCDYMTANFSRLPVPEIEYKQVIVKFCINSQTPTLDLIKKYKEDKTGKRDIDYGDVSQFMPEQIKYAVKKPDVDINFKKEVKLIEVLKKNIHFEDGECIKYGCIINTMPMNIILKKLDIWQNDFFLNIDKFFLSSKAIYYKEEEYPGIVPENVTIVDSLAGEGSLFYRKIYQNNRMSMESYFKFEGCQRIFPGKIIPSEHAEEIANDMQLHSIYSYGRYARWRTKEHLHETFKNLRRFAERKGQIGYC